MILLIVFEIFTVNILLLADGISIPTSYRTFISPLSSSKLYNEVSAYKDLAHFETPYVVMFQSVAELAKPQEIWQFKHPNRSVIVDEEGNVYKYVY